MKKEKDRMEKCKTCKNLDKRSNKNWIVCPVMPVEVLIGGSANQCKNYQQSAESTGCDEE